MKLILIALIAFLKISSAQANYAVGRALEGQDARCGVIYYTGHYPFVPGHPRARQPMSIELLINLQTHASIFFNYLNHEEDDELIITRYADAQGTALVHINTCRDTSGQLIDCLIYNGCSYRANAL